MLNSPQANSTATQAGLNSPAAPRAPNPPITPRTMTRRPATVVPTPVTNIPQPSIAQIGAARNAVTAAAPNLPAGTPEFGRELLVRYIAITNHAVAPAHAMANLMRANWDLNVALNRYMAQQAGESSSEEEGSEEEEGEGDETNLGDPEPDELPVDENGHHQLSRPKTNPPKPSTGKETKRDVCTLSTFNFASTDRPYSRLPRRVARHTPLRTPMSTAPPLAVITQTTAK